jgi:hypothetical protein
MLLMRANPLRVQEGGSWALEIDPLVVVEYLTSSPVNDTRRHYKREYFIYKLFM